MYVGIITCDERRVELDSTLAQLEAVGIQPDAVLGGPCLGQVEDNRWKAFKLAVHAYYSEPEPQGLLFLEDDIDIDPLFPEFLKRAESHDLVTTFCVMRNSLYPDDFERGAKFKAAKSRRGVQGRLVRLEQPRVEARRGFHGSQALYLPPRAVWAILEDDREFVDADGGRYAPGTIRHGFDFWLKDHARELGGIYAAWPNPVQHRSPPSTYGGTGVFKSDSYGLETYFQEE